MTDPTGNGTLVDLTNPSAPPEILGVNVELPDVSDTTPASPGLTSDPSTTSKKLLRRQVRPNLSGFLPNGQYLKVWYGVAVGSEILASVLSGFSQQLSNTIANSAKDALCGTVHMVLQDSLGREWDFWVWPTQEGNRVLTWWDVWYLLTALTKYDSSNAVNTAQFISGENDNILGTGSLQFMG